jgi:hypothetical protein
MTCHKQSIFHACLAGMLCLFVTGCGGVRHAAVNESCATNQPTCATTGERIPVMIKPAINNSGNDEFNVLGQYLHLKLAQILQADGRFVVVDEEALKLQAELPNATAVNVEKPRLAFQAELLEIDERMGSTVNIAIFSAQRQKVRVKLRLTRTDLQNNEQTQAIGEDWSSKGAWGVVAEVNREAMRDKKGVWKLDDSMVGIAAQKALRAALAEL